MLANTIMPALVRQKQEDLGLAGQQSISVGKHQFNAEPCLGELDNIPRGTPRAVLQPPHTCASSHTNPPQHAFLLLNI